MTKYGRVTCAVVATALQLGAGGCAAPGASVGTHVSLADSGAPMVTHDASLTTRTDGKRPPPDASPADLPDGDPADSASDARHPRDGRSASEAGRDAGSSPDARADDAASDGARPDASADAGVDAGPAELRYVGRTLIDGTSPDGDMSCTPATPCYEWSGTQVIARFSGADSFDLTMSDNGNYFDVYVDDVLQAGSVVGDPSQTDYRLATGLNASTTHEVRLYKRTEASTSGRTMILGYSFPNGGTLLPPTEAPSRRIEVVGDSISAGYGVLGPGATCTETPAFEDHDVSYEAITARNVGADLFTIASSGRGVYENIDGTTTGTLPDIYGLALPYVTVGSPSPWAFATWTPDVVVIELGTNDFLSAGDPGEPFADAYLAFLTRIRQTYPGAWIVCTDGPLLSGTEYTDAQSYIQAAVAAVNDAKVTYLAFPTQDPADGEGCDGHPSALTHQKMATQLTAALSAALGW